MTAEVIPMPVSTTPSTLPTGALADVVPDDVIRWRRAVRIARTVKREAWADWSGSRPVEGALRSARRWSEIHAALRHGSDGVADLGAILDATLLDGHEALHLVGRRTLVAARYCGAMDVARELSRRVDVRPSVVPRVVCGIGECAERSWPVRRTGRAEA